MSTERHRLANSVGICAAYGCKTSATHTDPNGFAYCRRHTPADLSDDLDWCGVPPGTLAGSLNDLRVAVAYLAQTIVRSFRRER